MTSFSRLQWSKNGVTIYDGAGGFVTRLTNPIDIAFLARLLQGGLRSIVAEQKRRSTFKAEEQPAEAEGAPV